MGVHFIKETKTLKFDNLSISRTTLKLIAMFTMLIDHIGAILFPEVYWLRWIGRIAFPIFLYQLVEGYKNTSNVKNYLKRLLLFAIISEVIFDLALFGEFFYWGYQNVYIELALCLITLILLDKTNESPTFIRWASIFAICIVSILLKADYHVFGILIVILFYLYKDNFIIYAVGMLIFSYFFTNIYQIFCLFSLPFIAMYNNNNQKVESKKSKLVQFIFYAFYPLHLLVLYFIKIIFF